MRFDWHFGNPTGLWQGPAALGLGALLIGVLILVWPDLFRILIAAAFLTLGAGLLGMAWRMRRSTSTTYHRIDDPESPTDPRA